MEGIKKQNSIIREDIHSLEFVFNCFREMQVFFENIHKSYDKCFKNLIDKSQNHSSKKYSLGRSFLNILNQNMNKLFLKRKFLEEDMIHELQNFQSNYKENCKTYKINTDKINKEASKLKTNFTNTKNLYLESQYQLSTVKLQHSRELNRAALNKTSSEEYHELTKRFFEQRENEAKCEIDFEIAKRDFQQFLRESDNEYHSNNEYFTSINKIKQAHLVESFEKFRNFILEISQIFSDMSNDILNLTETIENQDIIKLENPLQSLDSIFEEIKEMPIHEIVRDYAIIDSIQNELLQGNNELKKSESADYSLVNKNSKEFSPTFEKNDAKIYVIHLISEILKGRCPERIDLSNFFELDFKSKVVDSYLKNVTSLISIHHYDSFIKLHNIFVQYLDNLKKYEMKAPAIVHVLFSSKNICFVNNKNRKIFLISKLLDHHIWTELKIWKEIIEEGIISSNPSQNSSLSISSEIDKKENGIFNKCNSQ